MRLPDNLKQSRSLRIGNRAASALEVKSFHERGRAEDYVDQRAAEDCTGGDGGELLQFSRRKVADEVRRPAGTVQTHR